MKFRIVLEFDPETDSYSAVCPELPGCASAGDTEEEARNAIEDAIRLYLAPVDLTFHSAGQALEATNCGSAGPNQTWYSGAPN